MDGQSEEMLMAAKDSVSRLEGSVGRSEGERTEAAGRGRWHLSPRRQHQAPLGRSSCTGSGDRQCKLNINVRKVP